jgi:hypothetical protein
MSLYLGRKEKDLKIHFLQALCQAFYLSVIFSGQLGNVLAKI